MPLAALIAAQDQTDIGDGLRATLPLAGRTLIEYQAGLAVAAGVEHIVVLVERVPASLAQAIDRLRRQGSRIEIARSIGDAVDRFHPEERIILIADGAIAAQGAVDMLADERGAALLALPDTQDHAAFERIDAGQRWAGFALLDKGALEATAEMLGDWDLTSTLLRRLVQHDAARIDALNPSGEKVVPPPVLATGPAAIGAIEASLLRRADPGEGNWVELHLHRLVARLLLGPLVNRRTEQSHVAIAAAAIAWTGAVAAAFGLFWVSVLLLPAAAAIASAARSMARIWGAATQPGEPVRLFDIARHGAGLVVLVLLAQMLAVEGGWGWWLVAGMIPAALAGLVALDTIVAAIRQLAPPRWLASADALLWIAPLLAVLGGWWWMLGALTAYAAGSFLERFVVAWNGARIRDS